MKYLLLAVSTVALSGCSWLGHMSDAEYYNYGNGSYAGGACGQEVHQPAPAGCWAQTMSQTPTYSAPVSTPAPTYSAPVQHQQSYVVEQPQPVVQSYHVPQTTYQQPTYQAPQVQNYEHSYAPSQPVYTTGNYGSHAGTPYPVAAHQPLRGYYGMPQKPKRGGFYAQAYGGVNLQHGSDLSGISGPFTTGNIGDGSVINVADGTAYGWETEFDTGSVFGAEIGYRTAKGFRVGLEGTRSEAGVEGHEDITLDGADIGDFDGAALVGDAALLGATVNDFLADGQGDIEQKGVFLNGYYDFNEGGRFRPYVGAGVGMVDVDIDYAPSGSPVINGGETVFGYQGRVGAAYNVTGPVDVFTEYTYRATQDIETDNQLFTGVQDVKNSQSLVTVGARYNF